MNAVCVSVFIPPIALPTRHQLPLLPPSVLQSRASNRTKMQMWLLQCICICTLLWSAELGAGREIRLGLNKTLSCHQYLWILRNKLLVLVKGIFRGVCVEKEFSTMGKIRSTILGHH